MFFYLCPPAIFQALDLTEICVLNTFYHWTCLLCSLGFIEQQLKCISNFIQDRFTVFTLFEYIGKAATQIQALMGIHWFIYYFITFFCYSIFVLILLNYIKH